MSSWFDVPATAGALFRGVGSVALLPGPEWPLLARHDEPDAIVYTMHVPGYRKRDIRVEMHGRKVVVSGKRTEGFFEPRARSSFVESFLLPDAADDRDLRATLRDGSLCLTVGKKPARVRRISIRAAGHPQPPPGDAPEGGPSRPCGPSWWRRLADKLGLRHLTQAGSACASLRLRPSAFRDRSAAQGGACVAR